MLHYQYPVNINVGKLYAGIAWNIAVAHISYE